MKHGSILASLMALSLLVSCSQNPKFAKSAEPKDFDGKWVGAWNWDTNSTSTVEIADGKINAIRFPIELTNQLSVLTTTGEAEFQKEWSRRAPCVLVTLSNSNTGVPIYITKDKEHLIYDVDIVHDQRIIFKRMPVGDKRGADEVKSNK